ncbi:DinB family protein [Paenibacillus amylolyticus]|uniref:DinB family protein n=1 Tax=Paenibacillus amylolyticus TaxID=1451 RepID=UPI003EBCB657
MSYKAILLDQLNACYDDPSWFTPLHDILVDLTVEEAAYVQSEQGHSIWGIVNHLIFWNQKWLERYISEHIEGNYSAQNDATFVVDPSEINDLQWRETLHKLETVFRDWNKALEESDENKLIQPIPSFFNAPWWRVVSNLCTHNAYHIGQIMLLKKTMRQT